MLKMLKFDFASLFYEKRLSQKELADIIKKAEGTVSIMVKRGTIKPSVLRTLEKKLGDLSKFVIVPRETAEA
jgi:DNA-binding Xre family transcriptional regulator